MRKGRRRQLIAETRRRTKKNQAGGKKGKSTSGNREHVNKYATEAAESRRSREAISLAGRLEQSYKAERAQRAAEKADLILRQRLGW